MKNNFTGNLELLKQGIKIEDKFNLVCSDNNIIISNKLNTWNVILNRNIIIEGVECNNITTNVIRNTNNKAIDLSTDWFLTQNDFNRFLNNLKKYNIVNFRGEWVVNELGYNIGDLVYSTTTKTFYISLINGNIDNLDVSTSWGSFDFFNENEYYTKQETDTNFLKVRSVIINNFTPQWTAYLKFTAVGGWIQQIYFYKLPNNMPLPPVEKIIKIYNNNAFTPNGLAEIKFIMNPLDRWCIRAEFISSAEYNWDTIHQYLNNITVLYYE